MNLSRIRNRKGLSQRQLAEMIGADQSTVQRAEKGAKSAMLETYIRCADALGVTVADIFSVDLEPTERELVLRYRRLPEESREGLRRLLEGIETQQPQ